jgi:hypothetical protein
VVIIYEIAGRTYLDSAGTRPCSLDKLPDLEAAKGFLNNAVTINHKGCVFHYARQSPPLKWEKSGLLRYHRVVRVAADGTAFPGEYALRVSPDLGVRYIQQDEKEL